MSSWWSKEKDDLAKLAENWGIIPEHINRRTWEHNVRQGRTLQNRINNVGGASSMIELEHKELIQSPEYIEKVAYEKFIKTPEYIEEQIRLGHLRTNEQYLQIGAAEIEFSRLQEIQNQKITFNEKQNSGDFNETPITDINLNNSCSECTGTIKSTDPISEKQLTENYLKIGGIVGIGLGILLLYTRSNKK